MPEFPEKSPVELLPLDRLATDQALYDHIFSMAHAQLTYVHEITAPDQMIYGWYRDDGLDEYSGAADLASHLLEMLAQFDSLGITRKRLERMTDPQDDAYIRSRYSGDGVCDTILNWLDEYYGDAPYDQ